MTHEEGLHPDVAPLVQHAAPRNDLGERSLHSATLQVLRHFKYDHLPEHLKAVSRQVANLAYAMADNLPEGPELTTGLRKLLEAKDCFVRAALDG